MNATQLIATNAGSTSTAAYFAGNLRLRAQLGGIPLSRFTTSAASMSLSRSASEFMYISAKTISMMCLDFSGSRCQFSLISPSSMSPNTPVLNENSPHWGPLAVRALSAESTAGEFLTKFDSLVIPHGTHNLRYDSATSQEVTGLDSWLNPRHEPQQQVSGFLIPDRFMAVGVRSCKARQLPLRGFTGSPTHLDCRPDGLGCSHLVDLNPGGHHG